MNQKSNQYVTIYYIVRLLPAGFLKVTMQPLSRDGLSPSISVAVVLLRLFRLGQMQSAMSKEKKKKKLDSLKIQFSEVS